MTVRALPTLLDDDRLDPGESSSPLPSQLAGFRLVRRLAVGSRADIILGVPAADPDQARQAVVIKLFHPSTPQLSIAVELEALARADGPYACRLLDVTEHSGRPLAILERAPQGSVGSFLERRGQLRPGEAVTLLAPLATLIDRMHAAGVAHTALSVSTVHLGSSGEPVVLGFGHASTFAAQAPVAIRDAQPGVILDRERLAALCRTVLDHLPPGEAAGTVPLRRWISTAPRLDGFAAELEERLFGWAAPLPLEPPRAAVEPPADRSARAPSQAGRSAGAELASPAALRGSAVTAPPGPGPAGFGSPLPRRRDLRDSERTGRAHRGGASRAAGVGASGGRLLRQLAGDGPARTVRDRALPALRGVRRSLWVTLGLVIAALALAVALVPGLDARALGAPPHAVSPHPESSVTPAARPTAALPRPIRGTVAPGAAATALLRARRACLERSDARCLRVVDEPGSSGLDHDLALLGESRTNAPGSGAEKRDSLAESAVGRVQSLGGAALISLVGASNTGPASVLIVRSEAGWRIRDLFLPRVDSTTGKR
ncbi:hypothetical protein [Galbitalea soli]|uniref:Protein kinase domain-containing protein n=1 Tax=Galbitalea soli TaxID=1268042 RepID=A0A7C9TPK3_9MICO|nr:hypothetical protein [Galbitalea soli]NEM90281.1 hypothetical protein [Galbitalea soli]NYJ30989.1 hypothetical protein [Galbitalea soli]